MLAAVTLLAGASRDWSDVGRRVGGGSDGKGITLLIGQPTTKANAANLTVSRPL